MAQSKSRLPLILGLTAAGGVGYYLYAAGGDPKVAEKKFERECNAASSYWLVHTDTLIIRGCCRRIFESQEQSARAGQRGTEEGRRDGIDSWRQA